MASRLSSAAQRRAITAGGNIAAKVAPYLATAALVGAAGFAAYWLTSKLRKLRFKTWDELQYELANAYRASRQAAAAEAGRGLTPAESSQLSQWYKVRKKNIDDAQARGESPRGIINLTFAD